jgi:hypothetical protein
MLRAAVPGYAHSDCVNHPAIGDVLDALASEVCAVLDATR